jgi:hypothetical protein
MATDFTVERQFLSEDAFPPAIQKHLGDDASAEMKQRAAAGTVPAPPADTLKMLYQLDLKTDGDYRETIHETVEQMPASVVVGMAGKIDHAGVLDWLALQRGEEPDFVEELLRNEAVDDRTIARIARQADQDICDIVATNEVRILRTPAIIEALYQNANAPSAMVDRLLELARRNDISLDGLPGLQRALRSDNDIFSTDSSDESGVEDDDFQKMLQKEAEVAKEEQKRLEKLEDDDLTRSQRESLREELENEEDEEGDRRGLNPASLQQMSVPQKIRLATCGSRSAIKKLVNDPNRLVHMAAIESPRLKVPDVIRLAGQKSTPDDVLAYIANKRDWTQNYQVVQNLVFNPKTPISDSMNLLSRLRKNELKKLQRSRDVPHQISRSAKQLLDKRSGGRRA